MLYRLRIKQRILSSLQPMVFVGRMFLKEWILLLPTTANITRAIVAIFFLDNGIIMKMNEGKN
jgi:hypothetical protein